jgi:hypothetical protein
MSFVDRDLLAGACGSIPITGVARLSPHAEEVRQMVLVRLGGAEADLDRWFYYFPERSFS